MARGWRVTRPMSRFIAAPTREVEPKRTGTSSRNGGSIAAGEIARTRSAVSSVQAPRITPNCWTGTTRLMYRAP